MGGAAGAGAEAVVGGPQARDPVKWNGSSLSGTCIQPEKLTCGVAMRLLSGVGGCVGLANSAFCVHPFRSRHSPGLSFVRYEPCSEQCHLQVRVEATVRCAGLLTCRAQVAPRQEMPNLDDLTLRTAHAIGLLRATQSPIGGADQVVYVI